MHYLLLLTARVNTTITVTSALDQTKIIITFSFEICLFLLQNNTTTHYSANS
jgi:hypothetical protein